MKIKISRLKIQDKVSSEGRNYKLFQILNGLDNLWYSAFEKQGATDQFKIGYEFDADVDTKQGKDGKMYNNIVWPKSQSGPNPAQTLAQLTDIINRLSNLEKMVQEILYNLESLVPPDHNSGPGLPTDEPPTPDEPEGEEPLPF